MNHPKEDIINEWLKTQVKPITIKKIFESFPGDLESIVMASVLSEVPLSMDLKDFCRGMGLKDRIHRYSAYPLWFKTFIPQDMKHAVLIFKDNRDADGYAKDIILDWIDEEEYVNLIKNAGAFFNNQFKTTFKSVILHNEEDFKKNISDEFDDRISNKELEFDHPEEGELFYFLELEKFASYALNDLNEINKLADNFNEFLIRDVAAIGVIADNYVYFHTNGPIYELFDIEPKITFDKKGLTKNLLKELVNEGEEEIADHLLELAGGRTAILLKLAHKLIKKGAELYEDNVNISFSSEDEQDFYDRFASANLTKDKSIKDFFMEEVKLPLQKFYIKNRLNFTELSDSFFERQYQHFIQSRFYSKQDLLNKEQRDKLNSLSGDIKDSYIFVQISKRNFLNSKVSELYR